MPPSSPAKTPAFKVIDAWAMLAWVRDEPPAPRVLAALQQAEIGEIHLLMSWINAGGVYYILARKHDVKTAQEFLKRLPSLPLRLVLPEERDVLAAARLKAARRISYAGGFAAALAQRESASLMTGDPELGQMTDVLTIDWIGPSVP